MVEAGLDKASKIEKPGQGWVAADVKASSDTPLAVSVEGALRLAPDWVGYGSAWVQPTEGRAGANVGARFSDSLDLFAGGSADTKGNWEAAAGIKLRF